MITGSGSIFILQRDKSEVEEVKIEKPKPGTREYAAEDLKRLLGRGKETPMTSATPAAATCKGDEDEDLPPLIQALTRSVKHDGKGEIIKAKLKQLEQHEEKQREAER